jgi:rhodanese-related sulfurtransferase
VTAVAYDSGGMTNAARVWFILQYYGLKAVILNGGWPVLASAAGLPRAVAASSGGFRAVPGSGPVGLVDRQTLRDQLDGRAQVFDTRTRAEFTGEDARNRARSGHLPGARHLSHVDLIENGTVRPARAVRTMLQQAGFGPGDHIVTHCEGGGRAALGAGFDDVRVYLPELRGLGTGRKLPDCPRLTGRMRNRETQRNKQVSSQMARTSSLFEPLTLGGITLANRIAVSPMCQYSAERHGERLASPTPGFAVAIGGWACHRGADGCRTHRPDHSRLSRPLFRCT